MNYKQKRTKAGLSKPYVAQKLGMSLKDYSNIENGFKGIASDKQELFSYITNNSNESKLEQAELLQKALAWYETCDLDKEIQDFGYSRPSIAKALDCSYTKIWDYCCHHKNRICDMGVLEFYTFLKNENNRMYRVVPVEKDTDTTSKQVFEQNDTKDTDYKEDFTSDSEPIGAVVERLRQQLNLLMGNHQKLEKELKVYKIRCEAYEKYMMGDEE